MINRVVSVHSGTLEGGDPAIWSALERLVPVRFCLSPESPHFYQADAYILLSPDLKFLNGPASAKPCFVFADAETAAADSPASTVSFSHNPALDTRLRGRTLSHRVLSPSRNQPFSGDDVVLARCGDTPVWGRYPSNAAFTDFLSLPFPQLKPGELPFDYLNSGHYIQLLPLLHFLREIADDLNWQAPALRACLMFDDPNLHWHSYGFLPFHETVSMAERFNFHVACATVPLDGWLVHSTTAALFRQHSHRLSLLIHGNDHLRAELGNVSSNESASRLLAQALRRIDRLEQRAGFRASRVMAPPHGACRPQMLKAMAELGFEGACISPWSLRDWAPDRNWAPSFGLEMAELMDSGFPVTPRFRMDYGCEGAIVVSAFLDRPVVPVGHHDSLAEGLELLGYVAGKINSLGDVIWGDMKSIVRSNYYTRRSGSTLCIRPYSSNFTITAPDDVTSIMIDGSDATRGNTGWQLSSSKGPRFSITSSEKTEVPAEPGTTFDVKLCHWGTADYRKVPAPLPSVWAPARRVLCEVRDRVSPYLRRKHGNK